MSWQIAYARHALEDARKLAAAGLRNKTESLLSVLRENPFQSPPLYEKLVGDLLGAYS